MPPRSPRRPRVNVLGSLLLGCAFAVVPIAQAQQRAPVPAVNAADRRQVVDLYRNFYGNPAAVPMGWSGNAAAGAPGELSDDYRRLTVQRINYFRSMSGLGSDVALDPVGNAICQQAALMFAAQKNLSHTPPPSWRWWTPDAAKAAGGSNIRTESDPALDQGPDAVTRYIADPEPNNAAVGHRRWLLFPGQTSMASGSVPAGATHWGANAIWVLGPFGARPASAPEWTAWPPAGFVPAPLVFNRWSFSYRNADFSGATVAMTKNGAPAPVLVRPPESQSGVNGVNTYVGDNTLVWEPQGNVTSPSADEVYRVTLDNVLVAGAARRFVYTVTSVDPDAALAAPAVPVASLGVQAPRAVRRGGVKAKFVINLSAPAPGAGLPVAYAVSGSAVGGADYRALTGVALVPAGATRVKVKVVPAAEPSGSPSAQTVTLSLREGPGHYAVDPAATVGQVSIVDE